MVKQANLFHSSIAAMCIAAAIPVTGAHAENTEDTAKKWFKETYAVDYINGAENFWDHYADNVYFVTPDSAHVYAKDNLVPFLTKAYLDIWTANGLSKIELLKTKSTVLGDNTIGISGTWRLENDAGETVAHCKKPKFNYILDNTSGVWKIIAEFQAPCSD